MASLGLACVRRLSLRSTCIRKLLHKTNISNLKTVRFYKKYEKAVLGNLYRRRLEEGPEPTRRHSEFSPWNYDAEIFAFGKRLGEEFHEETLRKAFTHRTYIEQEESKWSDLGVGGDSAPLNMSDNEELAKEGMSVASHYIKVYLRNMYPLFFEEGICAVHDFLMETPRVAYIGSHLGIDELILSTDYPPEMETQKKTLMAIIGALANDQGVAQAQALVRDFFLPMLIGKDISEIWGLVNPMGLLTWILAAQGLGEPEPRLIHQSASSTIMALYQVGIYSDRELIGQSPGETMQIAEEMAARNALNKILKIHYNDKTPMKLGNSFKYLHMDFEKMNPSIKNVRQSFSGKCNATKVSTAKPMMLM